MTMQIVEWHEKALGGLTQYAIKLQDEIASKQVQLESMKKEIALRTLQIEEAKRRGLQKFDDEKLLVRRKE